MKAVLYLRESEEDRGSKNKNKDFITTSIKNQESDGREVAKKYGDEIIKVFKDINVPSTEINRKGLTDLLFYVRTLLPIKVYIKDYTRLGRYYTFMPLRDKLVRAGIKKEHIFFWTNSNSNGVNTDEDEVITLQVVAHYFPIAKNRRDFVRLIERKRQEKKPMINPPFGYKWKNKDWIVVQRKQYTVLKVFNNFLKDVNNKITCKDLMITKGLYYRILNNYKTYYGILEFDIPERDSSNNVIGKKRITYECDYEKILTKETYDLVESKINMRLQSR